MKKQLASIASVFALSFFTLSTFAQDTSRNVNQKVEGENGTPKLITFKENTVYKSSDFQKIFQDHLGLKQNESFLRLKSESDNLGFTHEKFQLFNQGIKVEFATYTIHSQNGKLVSMSGEFYKLKNVITMPSISAEAAFNFALTKIGATKYLWEDKISSKSMEYVKPQGELVLLPSMEQQGETRTSDNVRLAYKFDIYATAPISRGDIYVDAVTGEILFYNATIKHLGEHNHCKSDTHAAIPFSKKESNVVVAAGTAATRYSGSQQIQTSLSGSSYILSDVTRGGGIQTYNCNRTGTLTTTNFTDADNNWTAAEFNNTNKDNGALDAHWGSEMTYDYWSVVHGRNSYNNAGAKLKSYVHFNLVSGGYGSDQNNAFWNGSAMIYGDGSGTGGFDILTGLDVTAHEIGHAICSSTANLAYQRESGAMNEGFSDIWGACVEYRAAPSKATWLIGEDIERRSGHASLRSMSNPNSEGQPDTYGGSYWQNVNCGTPSQSNDQCGVHTNSGVLNYWFYILTTGKSGTNDIGSVFNVAGIGIDKAAKIAFRTESVYLTSNSTYANARTYGIQSATELYGVGSAEVIATTNAFYAVGIGAAYAGPSDTVSPTTPSSLVASGTTSSSTNLSWSASTDNVGVTGYNVYRGTTLLGTVSTTTYAASGLTASTAYLFTVKAKDAAGNLSAASNSVNVTTLVATVSYCASQGNSASDELIGRVQIGTINNPSTGGTGYSDFTSISTNLTKGVSTTITITPTWTGSVYSEGYAVWIDLNNDKDFDDAGELVWSKAASSITPATGSFTVPTTATSGATRMRVAMRYNAIPASCGSFDYGQVEDYTVNLTTDTSDTIAPSAPTSLVASGTTQTTTSLSWTASTDNVGVTGYDVYRGTTLLGSVTATTYNVTGLTASTAYTFSVKAKDAAGNISASSNVVNVTTSSVSVTYCNSKGNSVADEYIDYVAIGGISNVTGANGGYGNFTNLVGNISYGSNSLIVSSGFTGSTYTEYWAVWIDFNQNGTFESTELVESGSAASNENLTGTVTIPTSALAGSTRMRVSMKYGSAPTACEIFGYGEVEDYTVNIGGSAISAISNGEQFGNDGNIFDFILYPNPVVNMLNISLVDNRNVSFKIYNMIGQEVNGGELNQNEINVSNLESGIYIFELNDGQKTVTKKFIKK